MSKMERVRPRPSIAFDNTTSAKTFSYSFTQVVHLFKGIVTPRHKPHQGLPLYNLANHPPYPSQQNQKVPHVQTTLAHEIDTLNLEPVRSESVPHGESSACTQTEPKSQSQADSSTATVLPKPTDVPSLEHADVPHCASSSTNPPLESNDQTRILAQDHSDTCDTTIPQTPTDVQTQEAVSALVSTQAQSITPLVASNSSTQFVSSTINTIQFAGNAERVISIGQNLHVLPCMHVPDSVLKNYRLNLEERLIDELAQQFRAESAQPELMMVTDKAGMFEPIILITCWNQQRCRTSRGREKLLRELQKRVRRLQTVHDCGIRCYVYIDNIFLLAAIPSHNNLFHTTLYARWNNREVRTFNGINLCDQGGKSLCTLGGFVEVAGHLYGLTTEHALRQNASESSDVSEILEMSSSSSTTESETPELNPARYSEIRDNAPVPVPKAVVAMENSTANKYIEEEHLRTDPEVLAQLHTVSEFAPTAVCTDWALLRITSEIAHARVKSRGNLYRCDTQNTYRTVNGILKQPSAGLKVLILAGDGVLDGVVGQNLVPLILLGQRFSVTQVVLEQPLAPGLSGSWVVKDNLVVGVIIAGRWQLPLAYFIPFMDVMTGISTTLQLPVTIYKPGAESDYTPKPKVKALPNTLTPRPEVLSKSSASDYTLKDDVISLAVSPSESKRKPGNSTSRSALPTNASSDYRSFSPTSMTYVMSFGCPDPINVYRTEDGRLLIVPGHARPKIKPPETVSSSEEKNNADVSSSSRVHANLSKGQDQQRKWLKQRITWHISILVLSVGLGLMAAFMLDLTRGAKVGVGVGVGVGFFFMMIAVVEVILLLSSNSRRSAERNPNHVVRRVETQSGHSQTP